MRRLRLGTLRTRILVLATVPLTAMIVALLFVGHETARSTLTRSVRADLRNASRVFVETVRARREALLAQARVTAGDPRFFATFSVPADERGGDFARTLELLAHDFLEITDADFFEIYATDAAHLARCDRHAPARAWSDGTTGAASVAVATHGVISSDHFVHDGEAMMVVDVPVFVAGHLEAILRLGRVFDAEFVRKVSDLTGSDVLLAGPEGLVAAGEGVTRDLDLGRPSRRDPAAPLDVTIERVDLDDAAVLHAILDLPGLADGGGLRAGLSRDLDAQLAPLRDTEKILGAIGLVTLLSTIAGALGIALGVTRPLRAVVAAARRLGAGDYDAPVAVEGSDEVAELARGFDDMRSELRAHVGYLEDVDKMKSDFIALAGHELKTPLTIIMSFNDLIQSGALGDLPDEVLETNGIIKDQLSRLDTLVQDILDLTMLEAKGADALAPATADLPSLVRAVVDAQASRRAERALDVVVDAPDAVAVRADLRLLDRAIRGLLDNAVRFTPDGGRIRLAVHASDEGPTLEIEDTGIGIESEQLRWITGKFFERGDIDHHRSGDLEFDARGLGLGLALTRAIVDAHGGRLDVRSEVGVGSRFAVVLAPFTPAAEDAAALPIAEVVP